VSGELAWYHEDGSRHDCDKLGCQRPATALLVFDLGNASWGWHLCGFHAEGMAFLIDQFVRSPRPHAEEVSRDESRLP